MRILLRGNKMRLLNVPRKTKEEKIFFKLIEKYNMNKEYFSHYVNLGNGKVMVIDFKNSWSFSVYKMDEVN
jgi:hypothetical protein